MALATSVAVEYALTKGCWIIGGSTRAAAQVSGIALIMELRSAISLVLDKSDISGIGESKGSVPLRAGAAKVAAGVENETSRFLGAKASALPIGTGAI